MRPGGKKKSLHGTGKGCQVESGFRSKSSQMPCPSNYNQVYSLHFVLEQEVSHDWCLSSVLLA